MQSTRRRFLQAVMAGAAAGAAPGWLRAQGSESWLAGFRTLGVESLPREAATLEGRWPRGLAGTLYRNGPAWFERGGVRYQHWFDGDGCVRAWNMSPAGVTHAARMVGTTKFRHEQRAGRFEVRSAGTPIANPIPARNNDDLNTANTSMVRLGGRVFALWEGGSAIEIDPATLEARGAHTWREDLTAAPFSAHPLLEADGSAWNFGSLSFFGGGGVLIWRIGADGKLLDAKVLESATPGYLHAFSMTRRHLVFMLMPIHLQPGDDAFFERMRFATDQPVRIALVPKDALDAPRWFEADFAAAYHFADAYERNGRVILRVVRHANAEEARSPMAAALQGKRDGDILGTDLADLHLDPAAGRARWEAHAFRGLEFPVFDARTPGDEPALVFAPTGAGPADAPYFNAVARFDVARGRRDVHRYGAQIMAEEHLFIAKPGSRRPGEGWLLGTLLDHGRGRSGLAVLDAEHVADGPLATAWMPYTTPLGFHGWFDRA